MSGPDHKYEPGPYAVCKRCGGEPHGLRDDDDHRAQQSIEAIKRDGIKEAWRVAHAIAEKYAGRPGSTAAREVAWALQDLAWPERRGCDPDAFYFNLPPCAHCQAAEHGADDCPYET